MSRFGQLHSRDLTYELEILKNAALSHDFSGTAFYKKGCCTVKTSRYRCAING